MKEVQIYYDENSVTYDEVRDNPYFRLIEEIELRGILENIDCIEDKRILDAGCGTGRFINRLSNKNCSIVGIDYSFQMSKQAKKKTGKNIVNGTIDKLPFKNEIFDAIFCFKVLPHVHNFLEALKEFYRVLKPGGVLIVEIYNKFSIRRLIPQFNFYTRWDSPFSIKRILNNLELNLECTYGVRTFLPIAAFYNSSLLNKYFVFLEKYFSKTVLNNFSGYYIIVTSKKLR